MKKFTAIMLAALMLIVCIPFAVFAETDYVEIDTVEELAAIKDGKYWLAADIDLSAASWTTIKEFSGVLDGNGHKITVPANTVLFDTVTGTVKNVNLVSASKVLLENDDISEFKTPGSVHEAGVGLGILANVAKGATIENVHTNVEVNYKQSSGLNVHVGALVGIALADYSVDGNNLVINRETVIKNCSTDGFFDVDWRWDNSLPDDPLFRSGFGGIVGYSYGNVKIENCKSSIDFDFYKNRAKAGGIVGAIFSTSYGTSYDNYKTAILPVEITNCLFDGRFVNLDGGVVGNSIDQIGGITGYSIGATLTNCVFAGDINCENGASGARHIFAYSNVLNNPYSRTLTQGCISVGDVTVEGNKINEVIYGKSLGITAKNNYLVKGQTIKLDASGEYVPNLETQVVGNTEYETAAAAAEAFVKANSKNFKLVDGKIVLIQPEFIPAAQPPQIPEEVVPTGDITVYLAVITVISLAALTVVAKKRLSE